MIPKKHFSSHPFWIFQALLFGLFMVGSLFSCSSEYHWVKAYSLIPPISKNNTNSMASLPENNTTEALPKIEDHGLMAENQVRRNQTFEILKTQHPDRIQTLKSGSQVAKTLVIKNILHERLLQNDRFSHLSEARQNILETRIAKSLSSSKPGLGLEGINNLILAGLIILVASILFFIIPGIGFIGLIFDVVAAVLIILGLVEMLG